MQIFSWTTFNNISKLKYIKIHTISRTFVITVLMNNNQKIIKLQYKGNKNPRDQQFHDNINLNKKWLNTFGWLKNKRLTCILVMCDSKLKNWINSKYTCIVFTFILIAGGFVIDNTVNRFCNVYFYTVHQWRGCDDRRNLHNYTKEFNHKSCVIKSIIKTFRLI